MENITPKQQAIINAYGEYWDMIKDEIDGNGWCMKFNHPLHKEINNFYGVDTFAYGFGTAWRPKSLKGIDNNNGWVRINSEDDLPKENIDCWFMVGGHPYLGYYSKRKCFCQCGEDIPITDVPHYQPIKNPLPPIY